MKSQLKKPLDKQDCLNCGGNKSPFHGLSSSALHTSLSLRALAVSFGCRLGTSSSFLKWIATIAALLCGISAQGDLKTIESGKFIAVLAGKPIGSESFTHQRQGDQDIWLGEVDLQAGGVNLKQKSRLVLNPQGRPIKYDLVYSSGGPEQSVSIAFGDKTYTFITKEQDKDKDKSDERPLPTNPVVLSNNVLHHNLLLARRYDWAKGGRQEFTAVPNTPLALESRQDEEFQLGNSVIRLRHLFLSIGGAIGANLWIDPKERLVKMDIPLQRAEVFLEGFEKIEPVPELGSSGAAAVDAVDVLFPSGDHTMAGTLTLPKSRSALLPGVVLITGSGPQNRDEDSEGPGGLKLGLFRVIAEALGNHGFAVLRYDDRGVAKSGGNFATASMTDLEDDARAALSFLKTRSEIDPARIGILGHSEGAVLGARIAAVSGEVKALVSMAGSAQTGENILRWQLRAALSNMRLSEAEVKAAADRQESFITAAKKAEGEVTEIDGQNVNLRWFKEFLAFDPLPTIRRLSCAVAILQGGRDVQVPPEDARAWEKALAEAENHSYEIKIFPTLGHLFTESSGEGIAELADARRKVSPEALDFIVDFLRRKL